MELTLVRKFVLILFIIFIVIIIFDHDLFLTKDITPAPHHHIANQTRQSRRQGADFDPEVCVGVDLRICCDAQACLGLTHLRR